MAHAPGNDITFYVATNGKDAWSGRLPEPNAARTDGPFATVGRARDAVRALKQDGFQAPVTVLVRGGKYFLPETLALTGQHSGAQDCPITYAAYPGEQPVLSGGRVITGWRPYQGAIVQADLPGARGGRWKFRQLFCNGERMQRARWPKPDPSNPDYTGWAFMEGPAEEGSATAFRYKPGTFRRSWAKPWLAEVKVFAFHGWTMKTVPVKGLDEDGRAITLAYDSWNTDLSPWYIPGPFMPDNRFYVENVLEELTQPGEWCLDSETGTLYFWPPEGSAEGAEVVAPVLERLVDVGGAWITLSGFTFTATLDGDDLHPEGVEGCGAMAIRCGPRCCGEALRLRGASHCTIEHNRFRAVGGNAIYLEDVNTRNAVRYNEISGAGANGICLAGSRLRHPTFNEVSDNYIHDCGVLNKYVAGVFCGASDGNTISHNRIERLPHHAINLADNPIGRNLVEYNEIRDVCREIFDNGAINCWMETPPREAQRCGHVIRYNFIADAYGSEVKDGQMTRSRGCPALGIYLDNYTSNCFVYGNIIVRCGGAGILIHGGKNNVIENNVVVDCRALAQVLDVVHDLPYWKPMGGFMTGNRIARNIYYQSDPAAMLYILYGWTPEALAHCDYNVYFKPEGSRYTIDDANRLPETFRQPWAEPLPEQPVGTLAEWQRLGHDAHSRCEDPRFVDAAHDDYRLQEDSPAFALGFQLIEIGRIGIRKKS